MASAAPAELESALTVLRDVAWSLADPNATRGEPKDIAVFVEQVTTPLAHGSRPMTARESRLSQFFG